MKALLKRLYLWWTEQTEVELISVPDGCWKYDIAFEEWLIDCTVGTPVDPIWKPIEPDKEWRIR